MAHHLPGLASWEMLTHLQTSSTHYLHPRFQIESITQGC